MNTAFWRYASFALLGMALAACAPSGTGKPSPPKPPAKAPTAAAPPAAPQPQAPAAAVPSTPGDFRAALLAPFSGRHAEIGAAMLNAAQLALYDAAGEDFVLMPMDTVGNPAGAAEAARQSVKQGAGLLLGPIFGSNVPAAAEAAQGRSLPVFAFSNDRSALRPGVWLFGPPPEDEVDRLVGHAANEGRRRLGVLAYDTGFGRYAAEAAARAAREHGAVVVRRGFLPPGLDAKELSERVRAFAGAPVKRTPETDEQPPPFDAVLVAAEGEALRSSASLLAFHGIDPKQVRYLVTGVRPGRLPLGEPSLAGAWFAGSPPEAFDLFARRYEAVYGEAPPRLAGLAYDATAISAMLAADRRAGVLDMATLTAPDGFFGAGGYFRFRRNGVIQRALAIFEIAPDGPRIVDPAPERFDAEGRPVG